MTGPLGDAQAVNALRAARLCSIAVQTPSGPHVTPEAFAVAAGRIWIVTSCKSVKVRSIRRNRAVAVLARSDGASVSFTGRAEVLAPWSPPETMRLVRLSPMVAEAVTRYAIGNLPSMFGYLLDLCRLPSGSLPIDRVLVSITPSAGLLTEGENVVKSWGRLPVANADSWSGTRGGLDVGLPPEVEPLLAEERDCAVAFAAGRRPVLLAGTWSPERRAAAVPWTVARAAGLGESGEFCSMLDDSESLRPTQLRGVMLRGPGRVLRHKTDAVVEQRVRRATWWNGFETGTVKLPSIEVVRGGRAG